MGHIDWSESGRVHVRALLLFVLVAAAIILPFCLWGGEIDQWVKGLLQTSGETRFLTAAILFALLALDVFLPVPSCLVSTGCGLLLGFGWGLLTAFMAMNLNCVIGYLTGRFCAAPARRLIGEGDMLSLEGFHARFGRGLLLALRPVPVLAEASVIFAGIAKLPVLPASLSLVVGNFAVALVYAAIGTWGREEDATLPAFIATVILSALFMAIPRLIRLYNRRKK